MVLPDSTMVFLNSGSTLKYSVGEKKGKREVFLEGEAWFDVAKDAQRPFFVHTSFYDVKVLGTQFNVKAYGKDNEVVTTLEKGSVQINFSNKPKYQKTTYLKVGEQIIYDQENNEIDIKHVNTHIYTSWKDNKLVFINMSLKELIIFA